MDIIFIQDLKITTLIGVHAWERQVRQTLVLNLELGCDCEKASATDTINATIDYTALVARIHELAEHSQFQLIESLVEHLANCLLEDFSLPWLKITLFKPGALAHPARVGVSIERGKK